MHVRGGIAFEERSAWVRARSSTSALNTNLGRSAARHAAAAEFMGRRIVRTDSESFRRLNFNKELLIRSKFTRTLTLVMRESREHGPIV